MKIFLKTNMNKLTAIKEVDTRRKKPDIIEIMPDICDLCGACVAVCPPNVMSLIQNDLSIDFSGCTYCSLCIDICPIRAIKGTNN